MKEKITITLPSAEEFLDGLDIRTLHPALATAEQALADAVRDLGAHRTRVGELTSRVGSLPGAIREGGAPASALEAAIQQQRSAALLIPQYEKTCDEMRQQLHAEQQRGRALLEEEVGRRLAVLQEVVSRISPVLENVRSLEIALGRVLDRRNHGVGVTWPVPTSVDTERANWRIMSMATNEETARQRRLAREQKAAS